MGDVFSLAAKAVETRLREVFVASHWQFEIVPDPMTLEEFKRLTGLTPMLALAWRGFEQSAQGRAPTGVIRFSLLIIVKNVAGRVARYLGDDAGPGLFPAMHAAIQQLHGFTAAELGTLFVTSCDPTYGENAADMALAMARIEFGGTFKFPNPEADDFKRLVSSFSAPVLPPDALPQDIITTGAP